MASTIWDEALGRIETKLPSYSFHTWFSSTILVKDAQNTLFVRVHDPAAVEWIHKHYSSVMAEALAEAGRPGATVVLLPEGTEPGGPKELEPVDVESAPDDGMGSSARTAAVGLSPRYSFDSFIVGASNQFAHAACLAVAEAPSRSYNPLFLYGGAGLGKTHLMHAIGHYVLTHSPGLKLTYVTAERFMNEVIHAIRYDGILELRERYRSVDVLLVDDIQFIAGKDRTQTEFFHTFNALHDAQKQIVLSSDCPPHQISELEDRLRSRFEWGLTADLQPPDLETKIAILKKKADTEGVFLPDDVALFIAGRIKSNIRELEGSLIRLIAFSSLTGRDISVALAQESLREMLGRDERAVTIDAIQKFVAEYYQLKVGELRSRNNAKSVAVPRQVAMYLAKSLTSSSLPDIGKSFGGKHHSTVIHSIRKVEQMRQNDPAFNTLVNSFIESIRG